MPVAPESDDLEPATRRIDSVLATAGPTDDSTLDAVAAGRRRLVARTDQW